MEVTTPNAATDTVWEQIAPLLDEAMEQLREADRDAIVLRFFQNKSLQEVGTALGIEERAAQKRVARAVEKLRHVFTKRGVALTTTAVAATISANAIQAAPVSLVVTASGATALAGTTLATSATKVIAMTTLQKAIVAGVVAAAVGTGIYEARQAASLRTQARTFEEQAAAQAGQVEQLTRERDDSKNQLAALESENALLKSNQNNGEVLRLRSEVARLRRAPGKDAGADANDAEDQNIKALVAQAGKIKEDLEQMPDRKIPELKLLLDVDWLVAGRDAKFGSEADIRQTLSRLRSTAKNRLPLASSLWTFTHDHDGRLPNDLAEMKPIVKSRINDPRLDDATLDAMLERYTLLHTGRVKDYPEGTWFIVEKAPVDKQYDSRLKFGPGTSTSIATGVGESGDPDDKSY